MQLTGEGGKIWYARLEGLLGVFNNNGQMLELALVHYYQKAPGRAVVPFPRLVLMKSNLNKAFTIVLMTCIVKPAQLLSDNLNQGIFYIYINANLPKT